MKCRVGVFLVAIWLGAVPSNCLAEVSAQNRAASASAFEALDDLARQTRAQGDLPRWSNPEHAKALGSFWNSNATLGAAPYSSADMPALLEIGDRASALYKTYLFATTQPGAIPDTAANTFKYQDEVARAFSYLLQVQVAQLEAITDFVQMLPEDAMTEPRMAGLQQMRLGFNETVTGLILMLRSQGLRSENRGILIDVLSDGANTIATSMPTADRAAIIAQIQTVLPALSKGERQRLKAVQAAFEGRECGTLCALSER